MIHSIKVQQEDEQKFIRLKPKFITLKNIFILILTLCTMDYEILLNKIMNSDEYIRYATICDMDANVLANKKRDGVTNYISEEKTKESLVRAVDSWKFRNNLSEKIGKGHYVLAVYDNLRRFTMPVGDKHLLLLTLDNQGGQMNIINKITGILSGDYTIPQTNGPQS